MFAIYNLQQVAFAIARCLCGLAAYALAWFFFDTTIAFVAKSFGQKTLALAYGPAATTAILLTITAVGSVRSRRTDPYYNFYQSGLRVPTDDFASTWIANQSIHRVTGSAYILGQIFLSGPLQLIAAIRHIRNLVRPDHGLEPRLQSLLSEINTRNKWEDVSAYRARLPELTLLIHMGKIDYSRTKQKIRAK